MSPTPVAETQARRLALARIREQGWKPARTIATRRPGAWEFDVEVAKGLRPCVVVRNGKAQLVQGAILKCWRQFEGRLGYPTGEESFAASSLLGRCQRFQHGVVIWEVVRGPRGEDLDIGAWPHFSWKEGAVHVVAATFDLRGSTELAKTTASRATTLSRYVERAVQAALEKPEWHDNRPFLKGTGDGVMLIAEVKGGSEQLAIVAAGVLEVCKEVVAAFRKNKNTVPLGCAIEHGRVVKVFRYGRPDFLGDAINQSAKLQSIAWDEIVVGPGVGQVLAGSRAMRGAVRLGSKGWQALAPRGLEARGFGAHPVRCDAEVCVRLAARSAGDARFELPRALFIRLSRERAVPRSW